MRKILVLCVIFLVSVSVGLSAKAAKETEFTEIKFTTYFVGSNPNAPYHADFVDRFMERYPEVKVVVEEIPTPDDYDQKMRVLLAADELPDIILATGYDFMSLAGPKNALLDFGPYLEADPEWKAHFPARFLEFNSRDGKVYGLQTRGAMWGYWYNKELLANAGIDEPAETWEEFWQDCEKIKATGVAPLALQTGEGAWTTSLLWGAIIGTSGREGEKFMNTLHPPDFTLPFVVEAFRDVQKALAEYTNRDAIGGGYAQAANNFFNSRAAMIHNGFWMIGDFSNTDNAPAGFEKKVGFSVFPNNGAYNGASAGDMSGAKTKEKADAVIKWFKMYFSNEEELRRFKEHSALQVSPDFIVPEDTRANNPLLADLIEGCIGAAYGFSDYQSALYPAQVDYLSTHLALLAQGELSPEELAAELTAIGKEQP